jgi:hypothetical protein
MQLDRNILCNLTRNIEHANFRISIKLLLDSNGKLPRFDFRNPADPNIAVPDFFQEHEAKIVLTG